VPIIIGTAPRSALRRPAFDVVGPKARAGQSVRVDRHDLTLIIVTAFRKASDLCPTEWSELPPNFGDVEVARKLAVILHRMWIDGTEFNWSTKKAAA
jgi:hypothetical protein